MNELSKDEDLDGIREETSFRKELSIREEKTVQKSKKSLLPLTRVPEKTENSVKSTEELLLLPPLQVVEMEEDGNYLFRSLTYAYFGSQENYSKIRGEMVSYVADNWGNFS